MAKVPFSYQYQNIYNSSIQPNIVHSHNTALFEYNVKYFLQKAISVFKFSGLPEGWAQNYFKYVLFGYGYISVFNTDKYGVVCQECTLGDRISLYKQPQRAIVTNPIFRNSIDLKLGVDGEIIKLQPDYNGVLDIVTTYADLMTLALETAGVNLLNSKLSWLFFAENKTGAESFKKMYDQIASGYPAVVVDRKLLNDDGSVNWQMFTQNVGQNYITDKVLNDIATINNMFNSAIGIPNANTQKKERLITDEVNKRDSETEALVELWLETMRDDLKKVNEMFNLDISVSYRFKNASSEEVIADE